MTCLLSLSPVAVLAGIPPEERAALELLYQSTNGDNWQTNDSWLDDQVSACNWFGISCLSGRVVGINLRDNNLDGPLPDLSDLAALRVLLLRHNNLSGGIPDWLASAPLIEAIDLGFNPKLGGTVPAGLLNSSTLRLLWLDNAGLSGELPAIVQNNFRLRTLAISDNQITGLPSGLERMNQLQYLLASMNDIAEIPSEVTDLSQLRELDLRGNSIINPPAPEILGMGNLQVLDLSANGMQGNLESWIETALADIDFIRIPTLKLADNLFDGPLPSALMAERSWASIVDLSGNRLSGPVPDSELRPTSDQTRRFFDLSRNLEMTGTLSDALLVRVFIGRLEFNLDWTGLNLGGCGAWRAPDTFAAFPNYWPGTSSWVNIYVRLPAEISTGTATVEDGFPENWQPDTSQTCGCLFDNDTRIRSAPIIDQRRTRFRYRLISPPSLEEASGSNFDGVVIYGPNGNEARICGPDEGWPWSIFRDRFEQAD